METSQEIELLRQKIARWNKEERELVEAFFRDMLAGGPLWLLPGLLQFVANAAACDELLYRWRIAGTIPFEDDRPF